MNSGAIIVQTTMHHYASEDAKLPYDTDIGDSWHNHTSEQMLFDRTSAPLPPTSQNLTANQAMP